MTGPSPPAPRQACAGIRKDGQPCTITMLADARYCFGHAPDKQQERAEARAKGGRNKRTAVRLKAAMPVRLVPVFEQLEEALSDVLNGNLDPKVATAAAVVSRAMVAVLTAGEMEERLRRLEGAQDAS
jgi:hypothetical protein